MKRRWAPKALLASKRTKRTYKLHLGASPFTV
jgi:hypothetical protein